MPDFTLTSERLAQLKAVVPEAFVDGKVAWEVLRASLGHHLEDDLGTEHFGLLWPGKRDARQLATSPSHGTLIPALGEGVNEHQSKNLFVEGENLEVLKVVQKAYAGRLKLVYIDPPYNTGNDFIYHDDFSDSLAAYLRNTGQADDKGLVSTNTRADGRFHSNWLSMMYPRLRIVRSLLADDGVVFVSIDDMELASLVAVLSEIFGEENRVGIVTWRNVTDNNPTLIVKDSEFILCYAKNRSALPQSWRSIVSDAKDLLQREYERLRAKLTSPEAVQAELREFISDNAELMGTVERYKHVDNEGVYTGSESVHNPRAGGYEFTVLHPVTAKPMRTPANGYRFPEQTFREMDSKGQILYGEDEKRIVKIKKYLDDQEDAFRSVITIDGRLGSYDLKRLFPESDTLFTNPKPVALMKQLLSFSTGNGDLVMDLFAGSCSLMEAALDLCRQDGRSRAVISVQLPEPVDLGTAAGRNAHAAGLRTIADIGKERIRRVAKKLTSEAKPKTGEDIGFRVLKLAKSHFKVWSGYRGDDPDQLQVLLDESTDTLSEGWTAEGLLTELLLVEGFPLDSSVSDVVEIKGNSVRVVTSVHCTHRLIVCLDSTLKENTTDGLSFQEQDLFVCFDSAVSDQQKQRLADRCNLKTI